MSLETLLEAAQFLEWTNPPGPAKARGEENTEFHHYAKSGPETGGRKNSGGSDKSTESAGSDGESRRRPGGAGTREVHNKLEKNRRAHLKECFDNLKQQVPNMEDKKTSNLSILRGALRYIQVLKRREKELEQEMQRAARDKVTSQDRLVTLKDDLSSMCLDIDIGLILANSAKQVDNESDSTATAGDDPFLSDDEDMEKKSLMSQTMMPPPAPVAGLPRPQLGGTVTFAVPKVPLAPQAQQRKPAPIAIHSYVQAPMTNTVGPVASTAITSSVSSPINVATLQPAKTHVTQILQQTIAQRQQQQFQQQINQQKLQLLQQKGAPAQPATAGSAPQVITVNANNLGTIRPLTVRPVTAQLRPTVIGLPGTLMSGASILTASPGLPHATVAGAGVQSQTTQAVVLAKSMGLPITTATPSLGHPHTSTVPQHTLTPAHLAGGQPVSLGTHSVTINTPGAVANQNMLGTQAVTLATMKHIIAAPLAGIQTAQIVSPAQIQQLVAQQVARSRGTAGPQLVAPAPNNVHSGISSIPVSQLVSPVTVTQAQHTQLFSNTLSSQVLKTLGQIPIIQQSTFSLPMKPMVMVSLPSVVGAAPTQVPGQATVHMAMPTAPHHNSTL